MQHESGIKSEPYNHKKKHFNLAYLNFRSNLLNNPVLAIEYKSIYELFVLCGDFMFVILFPQFLLGNTR